MELEERCTHLLHLTYNGIFTCITRAGEEAKFANAV